MDETPVALDEPAVDETPVALDEPAVDETPVALDEPAVDETPVALDEPVADDDPLAVEEAPVVADNEPVVAESPADEAPVAFDDGEGPNLDAESDAVAVAAPADPLAQRISELGTIESIRRDLLISHGLDCVRQGTNFLAVGNWDRAREKFEEAKRFLVPYDMEERGVHDNIDIADKGIGEAYYRLAERLKDDGDYDDAIKHARDARNHYHQKAQDLITEINRLKENPPVVEPPPRFRRHKSPEWRAAQADVSARLKQAREYYATGEYEDCRRVTELVLHDHPWCTPALHLLRKLAIAQHRYVEKERETTRDGMMRDVTGKWTPGNYGINYISGDIDVGVTPEGAGEGSNPNELKNELRIKKKMESIIIPELDLRNAPIETVIRDLAAMSREYDETTDDAKERGINLILNLGDLSAPADMGAVAASDNPWDSPEAAAPAGDSKIPPLTMNGHYMPLSQILDSIMQMTGLKYRIQGNAVMVMPKNTAEGDLIHRMYNVLPSIGERVAEIPGGTDMGGGDDVFGGGGGASLQSGSVKGIDNWKKFFLDLGVQWPDGSSIKYMPSIGKLVVLNTAPNLATLENVLGALNVTPFQVEIEVRFVEVGQKDLNSLGFEWILNDDWEIAEKKSDAGFSPQSRRHIKMNAGNISGGFNFLTGNTRENINDGGSVADNLAQFTSVLTNPELSLVLHALANRTNADLLSAPKVVAMNGSQAVIKSVVEYIYPTEYEVQMLESSNDNNDSTTYTGAVVEPQNFQMREVGVVLNVTPRVSSDGSRIALDLSPSVVSIPTWKNYGSTYPVFGDENLLTGQRQVEYAQLNMEQPFFPVRSLSTSVEIYNGSTVVMGGMITEERYGEEDKIPILGDIPILGHLFRYKYDQSEKKNLLIFVSARLVDPAGRVVKGTGTPLVGSSEAAAAAAQ